MRRLVRAAAVVALASPTALLAMPTALASSDSATLAAAGTSHPGLLQDAWFWQTAYEQANPPVAPPATPPAEPSGVPKGDLAVAHTATDSSSSKMSVLAFDLGTLKPGTEVANFVFSIKVDSSNQAANVGNGKQPIIACLPTRAWAPADGGDYTDEPPVDCGNSVSPRYSKGTYTFTISGIAGTWVAENLGVALVNSPQNDNTPYQVVFDPKTVKSSMDLIAPIKTPTSSGGAGTGTGAGGTGTTGSSGSTGSPTTDSGPTVSAAPPPSGPLNLPPAAKIHAPPPSTQTPQVAPSTASQQPAAAPAAALRAAPSAPPLGFWIGAAALVVLIAVVSLVLGDSAVPVANATTTKLGRVLAEREAARGRADSTSTLALRRV